MKAARLYGAMLSLTLVAAVSGCASAVNGRTQEVTFSSEPQGAAVFVDSKNIGNTPTTASLVRNQIHSVRIEKAGFVPYEMTTVTVESNLDLADAAPGMLFPPLVLLFIPGDMYMGGGYEIRPTDISARLLSGPSAVATNAATANVAPPAHPDQSLGNKDDAHTATKTIAEP